MKSIESDCVWLNAHIFYRGQTPECDRVILEIVAPFVHRCWEETWIERYFFIRYRDRGPHVRLRLFGRRDIMERKVKPALLQHVEDTLTEALKAYPQYVDGPGNPPPMEPLSCLLWTPYEPEIERYGGPDGVALAEEFSHYSSEVSIALLQQLKGEGHSARLGKGLLATVLLLHAFTEDRAAAASFAHRYSMGYLGYLARDAQQQSAWLEAFDGGYARQSETLVTYVNAVWEGLEDGTSVSETLDLYHMK